MARLPRDDVAEYVILKSGRPVASRLPLGTTGADNNHIHYGSHQYQPVCPQEDFFARGRFAGTFLSPVLRRSAVR